jgi:hypothetical protein
MMLRLTSHQIKELEACGFTIDSEGETATRDMTVTLFRFDDGVWGRSVQFPDDAGRTLEDMLDDLAEVEMAGDA